MSIPGALFSGMAFWMGRCYLWMRDRPRLRFSPSQKCPPVLKAVGAWHVNTSGDNCAGHWQHSYPFPVPGLPGMLPRRSRAALRTPELHRGFFLQPLREHRHTGGRADGRTCPAVGLQGPFRCGSPGNSSVGLSACEAPPEQRFSARCLYLLLLDR